MNSSGISHPLHVQHQRTFETNKFVYPVLSRRSRGISVGVNLNPDKVCNFDCIYCQVDRTRQSETRFVDIAPLLVELDATLRRWSLPARSTRPKNSATHRSSCAG